MTLPKLYLTIDDAPSSSMSKKVAFLKKHHIPAIFYVRGTFIEQHSKEVINAIHEGFLIGNHSYSHPHFSRITIKEGFEEILKAEELIDDCYLKAQTKRPHKIIRLPYADRGAGDRAALPKDDLEREKVQAIQKFLKEQSFERVVFSSTEDTSVDSFWDWDTQDFKSSYIKDTQLYLENMQNFAKNYTQESAVILLHDLEGGHHLFEAAMNFLLENNAQFLDFKIEPTKT